MVDPDAIPRRLRHLPATRNTPFLPPGVFGVYQDNDIGAINQSAWAFASPANTSDNPIEAIKAVIALEYLPGELMENPRWIGMVLDQAAPGPVEGRGTPDRRHPSRCAAATGGERLAATVLGSADSQPAGRDAGSAVADVYPAAGRRCNPISPALRASANLATAGRGSAVSGRWGAQLAPGSLSGAHGTVRWLVSPAMQPGAPRQRVS